MEYQTQREQVITCSQILSDLQTELDLNELFWDQETKKGILSFYFHEQCLPFFQIVFVLFVCLSSLFLTCCRRIKANN